jgi:uncharacterized protein (TIGR02646 family)
MKHIIKEEEPTSFIEWKNQANDDWTPVYNNLQGIERQELINSIISEQGFICCYCENEIKPNDCHVEHFKPQSIYPKHQLDYKNLLCSCQQKLGKKDPRHCGNSKEDWFDENNLISPLISDCESRFKYTFDGYILPSIEDDVAAKITIEKLNLGIDKLNASRNKAIEPFIDDGLSEEDRNIFVTAYLVDKSANNGRFNMFYTTIKSLFDN